MGRIGRRMVQPSPSARMMLKVLLISSFVGWVKCQESQTMTLEEKSVIR